MSDSLIVRLGMAATLRDDLLLAADPRGLLNEAAAEVDRLTRRLRQAEQRVDVPEGEQPQ
jgi:hypothetical protein